MADLLECLIQIKALRDTLERVASLSGSAPAAPADLGVWKRMADAERSYAAALGTAAGETSPSGGVSDEARRVFVALRHVNLSALERCTASQLAGPILWPGRRSTTVADLVAIMLAHDTENLGGRRRSRIAPEDGVR